MSFSLPVTFKRLKCIRRRSKSSKSYKSFKSTELTESVTMKPSDIANHTWDQIMSAYPILHRNLRELPLRCNEKQFFLVTQMIVDKGLSYSVTLSVMDTALYDILTEMDKLWNTFGYKELRITAKEELSYHSFAKNLDGFLRLSDAMHDFYNIAESKMHFIGRLQCLHEDEIKMPILNHFILRLITSVYPKFPEDHKIIVAHFLRTGIRTIEQGETITIAKIENKERCVNCFIEYPDCGCVDLALRFHRTNWQINMLDLTEWVLRDVLVDVMRTRIEREIKDLDTINLQKHQLPLLLNWLNTTVYDWMKQICEPVYDLESKPTKSELGYVMKKLNHYLYKTFAIFKLDQLHELVYFYPNAKPAVEDLTTAYSYSLMCDGDLEIVSMSLMTKASSITETTMSDSCMQSLYMKYKKVMDIIDPSGLLYKHFNKELVRHYRNRKIIKSFQSVML